MRDWVTVPFEESKPLPAANGHGGTPHAPRDPNEPPRVFIALPTYDGFLKAQALIGLLMASCRAQIHYELGFASLLAMNFNGLWTRALNSRAEGRWTHWAMHHADISAPEFWLDTLIAEQERVGADVLSAVVAIKDDRRTTSTGVVQEDGTIRRLTIREINRLPETFGEAELAAAGIRGQLVVNTGLWVCRFTEPWVEPPTFPGFNIGDGIRREPDGSFRPLVLPEDWNFSHWAGTRGLKVMATRKVRTVHWDGGVPYTCDPGQGGWDVDLGDDPAKYDEVRAARAAEAKAVTA